MNDPAPDLGRHRQGEWLWLPLLTTDGSDTPTWPAAAPIVMVYNDAGTRLLCAAVPPLDRGRTTGHFAYPLRLGSSYPAGHYRVAFNYTLAGVTYLETTGFEVLEGGHSDGPVVSMTFYPRPHADFLVHQCESGTRVYGRNPQV